VLEIDVCDLGLFWLWGSLVVAWPSGCGYVLLVLLC
jgi:hypothetical protein